MEYYIFLAILIMAFLVRRPFFKCHINPDTGPLAYYAYFKDKGLKLGQNYPLIFGYKVVLYYIFYLCFKFFGKDLRKERLFFAIYNLLTVAFLFLLIKGLFDIKTALLASGFYAFFASVPAFEGFKTNIESYAILLIVLMYYLAYKSLNTNIFPLYMVLIGITAVMLVVYYKLTFAVEAAGVVIWIFWQHGYMDAFLWIGVGCLIGTLTIFVIARKEGYYVLQVIQESVKQLFSHGAKHQKKLFYIIALFIKSFFLIFFQSLPLWLFGFLGICEAFPFVDKVSVSLPFIWLLSSGINLLAQRAFFPQMFIPLIAPVSIFSASYLVNNMNSSISMIQIVFFALSFLIPLVLIYKFYFIYSAEKMDDRLKPGSTYSELEKLGSFLTKHSEANDYILQWGQYVQLNVFANRLSSYTNTFMYIEANNDYKFDLGWRKELIDSIKQKRPKFIVVTNDEFPNLELIRKYTGFQYSLFLNNIFPEFPILELETENAPSCLVEYPDDNKLDIFYDYSQLSPAIVEQNLKSCFGIPRDIESIIISKVKITTEDINYIY